MIAVHPSREPKLMAGYATVALEMLEQGAQPLDVLFIPVGGGSLAAGMGLVYNALSPHTRLIGVQSVAAPALARAWHSGEMREYPVGETLADGLAARVPAPDTVAILREVLDDIIEVSEAQIAAYEREGYLAPVPAMSESAVSSQSTAISLRGESKVSIPAIA